MTVLAGGGERSVRGERGGGNLAAEVCQSEWTLRRWRGHCAGVEEGAR